MEHFFFFWLPGHLSGVAGREGTDTALWASLALPNVWSSSTFLLGK